MKFYHKGKELAPCMVSKAKHALGLPNKYTGNNKTLSEGYWRKTVTALGEIHGVDANLIEKAIDKYKEYNP